MLSYITWTVDPIAFTIPGINHPVAWYGILFGLGFVVGTYLVWREWKHERLNEQWFDKLFFYVIIAATVGARLGHCLFYDPKHYLANPIDILKVWEGGLASHGGTLGILIAIWIFSRRVTKKPMLWTLDRLVVPVGFVAAFIRMGNLMNHEIYGHATTAPWAFRFIDNVSLWRRGAEPIFTLPSHPTAIYEAICYILTSVICMWMYWKRKDYKYPGLIFGVFMIGIFLSRFFIEYFKNVQEGFELNMINAIGINMGQLLSIPFVIAGMWFMYKGLKDRKLKTAKK